MTDNTPKRIDTDAARAHFEIIDIKEYLRFWKHLMQTLLDDAHFVLAL